MDQDVVDTLRIDGKVAIVTGGNGGIGFGIAKGLAQAGAMVVIVGRNRDKCESAASEIINSGGEASVITTDIRDATACRKLVEQTVKRHGHIDILVNNSGVNHRKLPQDYTLEEWHRCAFF